MAFRWLYNVSGGRKWIVDVTTKDTETLHEGDMVELDTGEADLGATNDDEFIGVIVSAKLPTSYVQTPGSTFGSISAVDSTTVIEVVANVDAVYTDDARATATVMGANLDLAGATGAQVLATDSNHDFTVVLGNTASENTLVKFAPGEHYLNP